MSSSPTGTTTPTPLMTPADTAAPVGYLVLTSAVPTMAAYPTTHLTGLAPTSGIPLGSAACGTLTMVSPIDLGFGHTSVPYGPFSTDLTGFGARPLTLEPIERPYLAPPMVTPIGRPYRVGMAVSPIPQSFPWPMNPEPAVPLRPGLMSPQYMPRKVRGKLTRLVDLLNKPVIGELSSFSFSNILGSFKTPAERINALRWALSPEQFGGATPFQLPPPSAHETFATVSELFNRLTQRLSGGQNDQLVCYNLLKSLFGNGALRGLGIRRINDLDMTQLPGIIQQLSFSTPS